MAKFVLEVWLFAPFICPFMQVDAKLSLLRAEMSKAGVDAVIVANTDPHNNEYVADRWRGRQWLTDMKGSNGTAVVTADWCGLWTDSRYYEIAEDAIAGTEIELMRMSDIGAITVEGWLKDHLAQGSTVSFNGAETALKQAESWIKSFELSGFKVNAGLDLINIIWNDRPEPPKGELFIVDDEYAGQTIEDKISTLRGEMEKSKVDAYLLGRTDESCWLLNFRGTDIDISPTAYCWTLVTPEQVLFFVDAEKLTAEATAKFEAAGVTIHGYEDVEASLNALDASARVLLVPDYISHRLAEAAGHCTVVDDRPIVTDLKAAKNETEIKHTKQALIDDGAALVKFYTWLYARLDKGEPVTELSASRKLDECRAEFSGFRHPSFESIMGFGPDGALNHYSVDEESDKPVQPDDIFLIDSGGNFVHGATDTTRTIPIGKPTQKQKEDYTLVLSSMLELLMLEFAEGANGAQLDGICRQALWRNGRNFKHSTGHGIGFGLEVHEGPQGFSAVNKEPIKLGMLTTIEPGCYRPGEHGVRIENIVHTVLSRETEFGRFFKFENLTFCPINTDLIDPSFLPAHQIEWLNSYHEEVLEKLSPLLNEDERSWLEHECRPLTVS
mgnify:CR=1 FL=1